MNPNYTEFKFPQIKAHPWTKVSPQVQEPFYFSQLHLSVTNFTCLTKRVVPQPPAWHPDTSTGTAGHLLQVFNPVFTFRESEITHKQCQSKKKKTAAAVCFSHRRFDDSCVSERNLKADPIVRFIAPNHKTFNLDRFSQQR